MREPGVAYLERTNGDLRPGDADRRVREIQHAHSQPVYHRMASCRPGRRLRSQSSDLRDCRCDGHAHQDEKRRETCPEVMRICRGSRWSPRLPGGSHDRCFFAAGRWAASELPATGGEELAERLGESSRRGGSERLGSSGGVLQALGATRAQASGNGTALSRLLVVRGGQVAPFPSCSSRVRPDVALMSARDMTFDLSRR